MQHMSFQTVQLASTITLILLTLSFMHHTIQCSQVNIMEMTALKFHPWQITRRQANVAESPTDEDIAYCESIEKEAFCSSGKAQSIIDTDLHCGDKS
jgi:hypothetical protein